MIIQDICNINVPLNECILKKTDNSECLCSSYTCSDDPNDVCQPTYPSKTK